VIKDVMTLPPTVLSDWEVIGVVIGLVMDGADVVAGG
jgi:hypothetical protein